MRQRMYSENVGGNWGLPAGYMEAATAPGRNIAAGISTMGGAVAEGIRQYNLNKEKHAQADGEIDPAIQRLFGEGDSAGSGPASAGSGEGPNEGTGEGTGSGGAGVSEGPNEGTGEGAGSGGDSMFGKAKDVIGAKLLDKYIRGNASLADKLAIANNIKTYEVRRDKEREWKATQDQRAFSNSITSQNLLLNQQAGVRAGRYLDQAELAGQRAGEVHGFNMNVGQFQHGQSQAASGNADADRGATLRLLEGSGVSLGGLPDARLAESLRRFQNPPPPPGTPVPIPGLSNYLGVIQGAEGGIGIYPKPGGAGVAAKPTVEVVTGTGTAGDPRIKRDMTEEQYAAWVKENPNKAAVDAKNAEAARQGKIAGLMAELQEHQRKIGSKDERYGFGNLLSRANRVVEIQRELGGLGYQPGAAGGTNAAPALRYKIINGKLVQE